MIKVKDGYAKLIGTTYKGSPDRVLLSNGGDKPLSDFATASGVVTALGTNGNYVTWTKNGTVNNLTVPYATKSNKLYQNEDLRSENTLPYASDDYDRSISAPFLRYNSTDGLNDGGVYHTSIIITPWSDNSGGSAHNIGLTNNGNVWIRSGTTEWNSWKKLVFANDAFIKKGSIPLNNENIRDYNLAIEFGVYNTTTSETAINKPFTNYGTLVSFAGGNDTWLLLASLYDNTSLYVRSGNMKDLDSDGVYNVSVATDWKKVAFIDTSSLTPSGGTLTINGNLITNKVASKSLVSFIGNDNTERIALQNNSSNDLLIGGGYTDRTVYLDANIFRSRANTTVLGGKVGIGTDSPTARLHVNGDSIINGKLTVGGNLIKFKTPSMYIGANGSQIYFETNSGTALVIENMAVRPSLETGTLGTLAKKWQRIYTKAINIGNASITWDDENQCLRVNSGIASITGDTTINGKLTATSLAVNSTTLVTNLNAEMVDGLHKDEFQQAVYTYFPTTYSIANTTTLANIISPNLTSDSDSFKFYDTKFYGTASSTSNRAQIAYGYAYDNIHFRRYYKGAWTAWKTVAFTDSDITGNATTATSSSNLSKITISTSKSPGEDNKLTWCDAASTANGASGTAIDANGFPVSNNANGILWLGTHTGNYGGQLGISSNSNLYYRYASGGTFPNTWKQLAFTSDIPAVYFKRITSGFKDEFRTQTKGDDSTGDYIAAIRCSTASVEYAPQDSSGIAFGAGDTHGYLYTSYSSALAYIGGGNANKLKWIKQIAFRETTLAGYGITDAVKIATKSANVSESCVGYTTADHNLQNGGLFTGLGADGNYGSQLLGNYVGTGLYYRGKNNGTWTAWKTVAFTDSNVASATKLKTSRTIWGLSFDGTKNVQGALSGVTTITTSGNITTGNSTTTSNLAHTVENNNGKIGIYASTRRGLYDYTIDNWLIGTDGTNTRLMIGNIGIGTDSPTQKLDVNGNVRIYSTNLNEFIIHRHSTTSGAYVTYKNDNGTLGILGLSNDTKEIYLYKGDDESTPYIIYHTGNLDKSTLGLGNVQNTAFYKRVATVNGTGWDMAGTINSTAFTIYAPTTAGTSGQVLISSGGTPGWTNLGNITAGVANKLKNLGKHSEVVSSTTVPSALFEGAYYNSGMFMTSNMNDSATPCSFGNIINVLGNGGGLLLLGWEGSYKTGNIYYRSHRDMVDSGGWTPWRLLAFIDSLVDSAKKANTANKLTTARTINVTVGGTSGTAQSFDGSKNITIPVSGMGEAYLTWGGKNISGDISPIDSAMSNLHSANRLAFSKPDGITIEYSRNGSTWVDYGASDLGKINLVSGIGGSYIVGARNTGNTVNDKLRVTLHATNMGVYTHPRKLLLNIGTNHASNCTVTLEYATKGNQTSFSTQGTYAINGWTGWNSIPITFGYTFGGSPDLTSNIEIIRLTFSIGGVTTGSDGIIRGGLYLADIILLGDTYWSTPSTMAKTGHLYSYDYLGNATFPAKITATKFIGNLNHTLTFSAGKFAANTYNNSAAVTVNVPTKTSHLTNDSGYLTSRGYIGTTAVQSSSKAQSLTGIIDITASGNIIATSFTGKLNGSLVGGAKGNIVYQSATNTTAFLANPSTNGYVLKFNTSTGLPYWASDNNTTYTLPLAASGTRGGIKVGYSSSGANVAVQLSSEKAYVALTKGAVTSALGYTPPTTNTTYGIGDYDTSGLIKPWKSYTVSCTGPTAATTATAVTVQRISTTSGRYYAVEMDKDGRAFVNVPWTDSDTKYTLPAATSSALGGIKVGYTTSGKNYKVQLDGSNNAYVYVPWTDTKVTLTNTTTNANYRVLLSNSANDTTLTEGTRKSVYLTFNPQLLTLYTGNVEISGEIRTTTSGTHPKFRMWHDTTNNALYILSGVKDGSSTSGTIHLSGINANRLNSLYLDATTTYIAGETYISGGIAAINTNQLRLLPLSDANYLVSTNSDYNLPTNLFICANDVLNIPKILLKTDLLNVSGSITASGEITAYSDRRLKSNIKPLENRGYIQPMTYIKDNKECIGFIAQDVLEKYPELVNDNSEYLSLNYLQYVAVLQALIIELEKRIKELENGTRKL